MTVPLFYLGSGMGLASELQSVALYDRETYAIILRGNELEKIKRRKWKKHVKRKTGRK